MNGVKRFLGAVTSSDPSPPPAPTPMQTNGIQPQMKSGASWPPQSPTSPNGTGSPYGSPKMTTSALFLRKDKQRPGDDARAQSSPNGINKPLPPTMSSPGAGPSSPRTTPSRIITRKSVNASPETPYKRISSRLDIRDELLLSLLASDAVVDSREFEILSSEEVDELKKEQQLLQSRLEAMQRKLALETKIRDAALSLAKVNVSNRKMSKQTEEQLAASNRRVETAQKEWWRVSERAAEVSKRLLEHRAGVLSYSVRSMEKKGTNQDSGAFSHRNRDSGYETPNRSMSLSPVLSTTSVPFDGAHLFAGHADAVVPIPQRSSETVIKELEERLKAATDSLSAAGRKQAEMTRELSMVRLEKQEAETMMEFELQNAQDTIAALEVELPKMEQMENDFEQLEEEKRLWEQERLERDELIRQLQLQLQGSETTSSQTSTAWDQERVERDDQIRQLRLQIQDLESTSSQTAKAWEQERTERDDLVRQLRLQLQALETSSSQASVSDSELRRLQLDMEQERLAWNQERSHLEDEKMEDLARLQEEMDRLKANDELALEQLSQELKNGIVLAQQCIQKHNISLYTRETSLKALLVSIESHLENSGSKVELEALRRQLDEEVSKREALLRDIEEARRERDDARKEIRMLNTRLKEQQIDLSALAPVIPTGMFPAEFTGDAAKIVSILQPLWAMLPSPEARAAKFHAQRFRTGSPTPSSPGSSSGGGSKSLSELDVRSIKALYGANGSSTNPSTPPTPNASAFTIEGFAARVQALVIDDRSLVERLVRFAQAHDLLKKNAERAQKLAQEGSGALETYQKQVRMLEDRNKNFSSRYAAMEEQVRDLQDSVDTLTAQKLEIETQAAEQAETCRQLTEANNTLSARTLTLAEEAASAPEMIKKQLDAQLAESRAALKDAQEQLEAISTSEQNQKVALLDELNTMQTENGQLRAQLRALKK